MFVASVSSVKKLSKFLAVNVANVILKGDENFQRKFTIYLEQVAQSQMCIVEFWSKWRRGINNSSYKFASHPQNDFGGSTASTPHLSCNVFILKHKCVAIMCYSSVQLYWLFSNVFSRCSLQTETLEIVACNVGCTHSATSSVKSFSWVFSFCPNSILYALNNCTICKSSTRK